MSLCSVAVPSLCSGMRLEVHLPRLFLTDMSVNLCGIDGTVAKHFLNALWNIAPLIKAVGLL